MGANETKTVLFFIVPLYFLAGLVFPFRSVHAGIILIVRILSCIWGDAQHAPNLKAEPLAPTSRFSIFFIDLFGFYAFLMFIKRVSSIPIKSYHI